MGWTTDADGNDIYVDDGAEFNPDIPLVDLLDKQGITPTDDFDPSWIESPEYADYLKNLIDSQAIYEIDSEGAGKGFSTGGLSKYGDILKNFMGSNAGKGLMSLLSTAGTLAPLALKGGQNKAASVQYTPIEKFAIPGTYNPVDLGYEQTYRPTKWTPGELDIAKNFFTASPAPDDIYAAANKFKLDRNQLADVFAQSTGNDFASAKSKIDQYLQTTGKQLAGGYVPEADPNNIYRTPSVTSTPQLRTLYPSGPLGQIAAKGVK